MSLKPAVVPFQARKASNLVDPFDRATVSGHHTALSKGSTTSLSDDRRRTSL
jgi:hypothetical protein